MSSPTARNDGSPLTNLAGYRIDYGRMSGIYDYQIDINNPGLLTFIEYSTHALPLTGILRRAAMCNATPVVVR